MLNARTIVITKIFFAVSIQDFFPTIPIFFPPQKPKNEKRQIVFLCFAKIQWKWENECPDMFSLEIAVFECAFSFQRNVNNNSL